MSYCTQNFELERFIILSLQISYESQINHIRCARNHQCVGDKYHGPQEPLRFRMTIRPYPTSRRGSASPNPKSRGSVSTDPKGASPASSNPAERPPPRPIAFMQISPRVWADESVQGPHHSQPLRMQPTRTGVTRNSGGPCLSAHDGPRRGIGQHFAT